MHYPVSSLHPTSFQIASFKQITLVSVSSSECITCWTTNKIISKE
uniref:Uncharacterized protein n=1 Tax=Anguilla anguilla TaxID=7936 RepID=A0A0E9WL96_ANGAN